MEDEKEAEGECTGEILFKVRSSSFEEEMEHETKHTSNLRLIHDLHNKLLFSSHLHTKIFEPLKNKSRVKRFPNETLRHPKRRRSEINPENFDFNF